MPTWVVRMVTGEFLGSGRRLGEGGGKKIKKKNLSDLKVLKVNFNFNFDN